MSNRYYQGPVSDHFDGVRFFHPGLPASDKNLLQVLKWRLLGKRSRWPKSIPASAGVRPETRVAGLQITHVGHSSYLVQISGRNILVDPVWVERASPMQWAGPKRCNPPAIAFDDLPPIDAVLVTHNHYDHLDAVTLRRIWDAHRPQIFAPLGNDAVMRAHAPAVEVQTGDWWSTFSLGQDIRISIVPAYHWSSRSLRDVRMALWGGFVIEAPSGVVYCAGDTAYRDGAIFKQVGERFGAPTVAVLPIGAYEPRWFMVTQHANPEEAVQIAVDCGAKQVLGVHWGTFPLTDEPFDEPRARLIAAAQARQADGVGVKAMLPGDTWVNR